MEIIKRIKNSYLLSILSNFITKLATLISIFMLTVFFTPNFKIISFPIFLLSSFTIIILEYLANTLAKSNNISFGRGIIGFTIFAIIIYITQYFIAGYSISIISTLIASAIYGIIASMLDTNI